MASAEIALVCGLKAWVGCHDRLMCKFRCWWNTSLLRKQICEVSTTSQLRKNCTLLATKLFFWSSFYAKVLHQIAINVTIELHLNSSISLCYTSLPIKEDSLPNCGLKGCKFGASYKLHHICSMFKRNNVVVGLRTILQEVSSAFDSFLYLHTFQTAT